MSEIWDEISDAADRIAIEMYSKEWKDLPHDKQDEVMEMAEHEVL